MFLARFFDRRDHGHEAFVADYTQAFLNAEVRDGEQFICSPPEGSEGTETFVGRTTCGLGSVQSHSGLTNIAKTLAGTIVQQVEGTWFQLRRTRPLFLHK